MQSYFKIPLARLPSNVGVDQDDESRSSDNREGHISFGPFMTLDAGHYFCGFHVRALVPLPHTVLLKIDVVRNDLNKVFATNDIRGTELLTTIAGLVGAEFTLGAQEANIEARLWVSDEAVVNVRNLVIFRRRPPVSSVPGSV